MGNLGGRQGNTIQTLTMMECETLLPKLVGMGCPVLLLGPPGIGKTQIWRQVAGILSKEMLEIILAYWGITDIKGIPYRKVLEDGEEVQGWLRAEELKTSGDWLIDFDEITSAPPSVAQAAMQIILEGRLGNVKLGPGVSCVGAGNRPEDHVGHCTISAAMMDRFFVVNIVPDAESTIRYFARIGAHPDIIGFLRARPDYVYVAPAPFRIGVTPRGLEETGKALGGFGELEYKDVGPLVVGMRLGEEAGADFAQYLRLRDEAPAIRDVWASPGSVRIPASVGVRWALFGGMMLGLKEEYFGASIEYWARVDKAMLAAWISEAGNTYDWVNTHEALGRLGRDEPELARALLGR